MSIFTMPEWRSFYSIPSLKAFPRSHSQSLQVKPRNICRARRCFFATGSADLLFIMQRMVNHQSAVPHNRKRRCLRVCAPCMLPADHADRRKAGINMPPRLTFSHMIRAACLADCEDDISYQLIRVMPAFIIADALISSKGANG